MAERGQTAAADGFSARLTANVDRRTAKRSTRRLKNIGFLIGGDGEVTIGWFKTQRHLDFG